MELSRRIGTGKFLSTVIGLSDDIDLLEGSIEDVSNIERELNYLVHIGMIGFSSVNDYGIYTANEFQTLGVVYKSKGGLNKTAMFPMFRGIVFSLNANKNSQIAVYYGVPEVHSIIPIGGFKGLFFE